MNRERRPLPALTGLRFFLATWVVVFHVIPNDPSLEIPWLPYAPLPVDCLLRTGYVAVTIFFALSGFVLAYNYDLGKTWTQKDLGRFGVARFARIYPAYLTGLIALIPVAVYRIWSEIPLREYSLTNGFLNVFLIQAWFPKAALTWNYPGWSLSGEAFFYASFPFLGYWLWKLERRGAMLAALGGLWALSMAAPLAAVLIPISGFGDVAAAGGVSTLSGEPWASLISYNPLAGLPAFCTGIVLARLFRSLPASSRWFGRGDWLGIPALATLLVALANADVIPLPLVHNGLLLPAYSALIFGLALGGGVMARLLALSPLVFLGNASYAMYILHFPIAEWLVLSGKFFHYAVFDNLGWTILFTFLVIGGSGIFYRFVEEPLHQKLRKALSARLELPAGSYR